MVFYFQPKATLLFLSPGCLFLPDFIHGTGSCLGFSTEINTCLPVGQGPSPILSPYLHQEKYILERTLNLMSPSGAQCQWYFPGRKNSCGVVPIPWAAGKMGMDGCIKGSPALPGNPSNSMFLWIFSFWHRKTSIIQVKHRMNKWGKL